MKRFYLHILFSFLVAMLVTLLPLPYEIHWMRPEWITLVLIYWLLAMPEYVGITFAWSIGLLVDLIYGSILGQYAIAFAIVGYIINFFRSKMRLFPIWQPIFIIFIVIGCEKLLILLVEWLIDHSLKNTNYWMSTLTSAMIWPGIVWVLDKYQKKWDA